jgi:fumarate reductase flavoprotein subunit
LLSEEHELRIKTTNENHRYIVLAEFELKKGGYATTKNINCDLLVVGGGGGGLVAAVKAAESGKKVVLLEKTNHIGGASLVASGISAVNSKIQVAAGTSERLVDELFSLIMNTTQWVPNPRVVKRFVITTGVFADWVEAKKPGTVDIQVDNRVVKYKKVRSLGADICKLMKQYCQKLCVDVHMETRATRLLTDKQGAVVGVLASGKDTNYKIQAKSVILSTGSFSRDREMLKKYFPQYFDNNFKYEFEGGEALGRFADGDGIRMAQEIGSMPANQMDVMVGGPSHHGSVGNRARSMSTTRVIMNRPEVILINKNGKRFMAEGNRGSHAMLRQPEALAYAVFDSDSLAHFLHTINPLSLDPVIAQKNLLDEKLVKDRLAEENNFSKNALGASRIANTIEELAAFIGADSAVFKAEVKRFNAFCDKGHDDDFSKNPKFLRPVRKAPFYAMRGNIFWQCTRGGIVINENMEVIGKKGM